jgi:hypothetical protein
VVCVERTIGSEIILDTPDCTPRICAKGTWVMWNLIFICLETGLVSVQDISMVYAKCTIGSEILLDIPCGNPR